MQYNQQADSKTACKGRRITGIISIALFTLFAPMVSLAQSLEGVWIGTELETIGGDNAGVVQVANPRILIYTSGFFSWAFENNDRPTLNPDSPDSQRAAALQGLNVAAGTYLVDGTTIHYIRRISGNPNGQLPENQPLVREIRALTDTLLETSVTNDQGVTTILRYRRAE